VPTLDAPEIQQYYTTDAAGNPVPLSGAVGFRDGILFAVMLHELMHVCMGPSQSGQQAADSCVHLSIDYTVSSQICAATTAMFPPGAPPYCVSGFTAEDRAKFKALCTKQKEAQGKWNTDAGRELAESCATEESTEDLDDLVTKRTSACQVGYPPLDESDGYGSEIIPGCGLCDAASECEDQ